MRRVVGILMIVLGMTAVGVFVYGIQSYYGLPFDLLMILSTVFIITGGVFCLRRKYWIACFISSLLLPCFVISLWVWIFPYGLGLFSIGGGIISAIFVYRRRREWQELPA
jgi:hypothetical protein